MSGIAYYEQLIHECNIRIIKYERQINGLRKFARENDSGTEQFTIINGQRRTHIKDTLADCLKHPVIIRLDNRISSAIDTTYENSVLNNFQAVRDDILQAIRKLEGQIEEEKSNIAYYQMRIREIQEEERRAAERRAAEEAQKCK